jgi:ribonuclease HII
LHENVGYGTAKHLAGIKEHGITQWHRKTFGCCKTSTYNPVIPIVVETQN